MKNSLNNILRKLKHIFKSIFIYVVILVSVSASFFIGMYYQKMNTKTKKHEISKILKHEVVLAVDENNNLIVIQKSTGDYIIFQDSIGKYIFNMYAKNVLVQNTQNPQ